MSSSSRRWEWQEFCRVAATLGPQGRWMDASLEAMSTAAEQARAVWKDASFGSTEKLPNDWLSDLDLLVDSQLGLSLQNIFGARMPLVSEERPLDSDRLPDDYLILDPIDGTRNALLGIPYFAISMARVMARQVVMGITVNVATGDLYAAARGAGFWINGQRAPRPGARGLSFERSVISTGFPHDPALRTRQAALVHRLVQQCSDIRRFASPTLDLCLVAAGQLHGLVEMLRPWDIAAGTLFLEEQALIHNAGPELGPQHFDPERYFVAGNEATFRPLTELVAQFGHTGPRLTRN